MRRRRKAAPSCDTVGTIFALPPVRGLSPCTKPRGRRDTCTRKLSKTCKLIHNSVLAKPCVVRCDRRQTIHDKQYLSESHSHTHQQTYGPEPCESINQATTLMTQTVGVIKMMIKLYRLPHMKRVKAPGKAYGFISRLITDLS